MDQQLVKQLLATPVNVIIQGRRREFKYPGRPKINRPVDLNKNIFIR